MIKYIQNPIGYSIVSCMMLASCLGFQQTSAQSAITQVDKIRNRVELHKRLTKQDEQVLLTFVDSKHTAAKHMAVAVLSAAVNLGIYPKKTLLTTIERKMRDAQGIETTTYLRHYRNVLRIGGKAEAAYYGRSQALSLNVADEKVLNGEEREFIKQVVSRPNARTQMLAGEIFVRKQGLGKEAFTWMLHRVDKLLNTSKGAQRDFWRLVRRHALGRSPKPTIMYRTIIK